jgi:uncharacterized repeat protein (TIGR02543 family)
VNVVVDGTSQGAVTTFAFTNVTRITPSAASFAANTVTFTITASAGAGGSISPSGSVTVNSGASQQFTITANSGFHVASVGGGRGLAGRLTTFTFNNVTANHTIAASFAANAATFTLAVSTVGNGTVAKAPDLASYAGGSSVQLTAAPASGNHFVGWSGDASGSVNPLTVTMDANKSITATFAPDAGGGGTNLVLNSGFETDLERVDRLRGDAVARGRGPLRWLLAADDGARGRALWLRRQAQLGDGGGGRGTHVPVHRVGCARITPPAG